MNEQHDTARAQAAWDVAMENYCVRRCSLSRLYATRRAGGHASAAVVELFERWLALTEEKLLEARDGLKAAHAAADPDTPFREPPWPQLAHID